MKKILVTGATGFVGGRLVSRLLAAGEEVRVCVRDANRLEKAVRDRVEIVEGSLEQDGILDEAVTGCSRVLHLAALARAYVRDPRDYFRINTEAVDHLLRAAARRGVDRVVHVSSVLALPPVDKAGFRGIPSRPTVYGKSKAAAEDLVRKYVLEGHDAVIVRPSRIYGPGPWNDANGTTRLIAMHVTGRIRVRPADRDVQANYVHVDDVAAGIDLAGRHGRCGEAYALGGENASLAAFLDTIAEVAGLRRRVLAIPPQAMLPLAGLGCLWGFCGGSASITPAWLNSFLEHRPMDISTSRAHLGYAPRGLREGISQTLNWLLGIGGGEQNVYRAIQRIQEHGA